MRIVGRHVVIVGGLLAAAAVVAWATMPRPVPVETAAVTKGRFVASVDEDGKTRVRERYVVAAPLAGRLGRIRFKVGDQVQVDDAVATITPSPAPMMDPRTRHEVEERLGAAEANLERAKAVVERARAQSDQANTDLARTRTLVASGATTAQALERAELAVRVADRDLRAAEFLNHAAEHELSQMRTLLARYSNDTDAAPESWNVTGTVQVWLTEIVNDRCPGFLESEKASTPRAAKTRPLALRVEDWIEDTSSAFAKQEGWFFALPITWCETRVISELRSAGRNAWRVEESQADPISVVRGMDRTLAAHCDETAHLPPDGRKASIG